MTVRLFLVGTVGFSPGTEGMLLSAAPVAALLGAATATRLARRVGSARVIWLSLVVTSPGNLLLPLAGRGWAAGFLLAGFLAGGLGQVVYGITQLTYRQATVPARLQCRVNATMRFLVMGAMPLGGLLGGALGEALGVRRALLLIGVGLALAPVPLLLSPLRHARDLDDLAPRSLPAPSATGRAVAGAVPDRRARRAGATARATGTTCRARVPVRPTTGRAARAGPPTRSPRRPRP